MENFVKQFNVSHETFENLSRYVNILKEWQAKMNLVSPASMNSVWTRHIADSYQLCQYLNTCSGLVCDIGSGAGFPALVMAIWALENRPNLQFKLIESITKKTVYLNEVKEKLQLKNVEILNERSENLHGLKADFVTARAVAELSKLLGFAYSLCKKNTVLLLPKGQSFEKEVVEAHKNWCFDIEIFQNEIEKDGVVLRIQNLRKKK